MCPAAVVFDWDNTLVDSWGTIHHALNETLAAMNHPVWTLEETKARVRLSLHDSFPRLFGPSWEAARQIYLGSFQRVHLDRLTPLPNAAALLEMLSDQGLYLAVVSNKTGRLLRREVEALGWDQHFTCVVGAGDAIADKPHRATIELALAASGMVPGNKVWYVGDTDIDILTAREADCTAVLVHAGDRTGTLSNMPQPDLIFADLYAIAEAFRPIRP